MATTSLKDYLEIVVDMEKNIFLQNQAISRLQGEIDELGKPNSYDKPLEPVKPEETNQGEILLGLLYQLFLEYWAFLPLSGALVFGVHLVL